MPIIKNYDDLNVSPERKILLDLIETALNSILPEEVFSKNIKLNDNILQIKDNQYDLNNYSNIYLLGFGKGSAKNSKLLEELLGEKLTAGYVIDTTEEKFSKIQFTLGTHPVISQQNVDFTMDAIGKLSNLTEKDLVIVVVCGGGSAMFEHPHSISLEQKIGVEKALLKSGADITEMNIVRQHLSDVKGGGLAQILYPARVATLIYSDVIGNDIRYIASGPTVKNDTEIDNAVNIINKYNLSEQINLPRESFINNPHDDKYFANVTNTIVLSNVTVLEELEEKAKELGINCIRYSDKINGTAKDVAQELISKLESSGILIAAGETTVEVKGNGKGGRNQETCLEALKIIDESTLFTSIGTDGWDFTEAAGAIADNIVKQKTTEQNLNIDEYLENNDSFTFFEKVNSQVITGRLSSNVADFMIVWKR
jgi:glycerate-2-kinase